MTVSGDGEPGIVVERGALEHLEPRLLLASDLDVSGTVSGQQQWSGTVFVQGNTTIAPAAEVNIAAGTVVKVAAGAWIDVQGELNANGTSSEPVTFTSWRDDAIGGEVSDPGVDTPLAGDWESIYFTDGDDSSFQHVDVNYAGNRFSSGSSSGYIGAFQIRNADVSLTDVDISDSDGRGVHVESGAPTITRVSVDGARQGAFQQNLPATPRFSELAAVNSGVNGVTISGGTLQNATTWSFGGLAGYMHADYRVGVNGDLTIDAGQTIKVDTGKWLTVDGKLTAVGTPSNPVSFTSFRDDSLAGDTNNDAAGSSAAPGDWEALYFYEDADVTMTNAHVHYAGNWSSPTYGLGAIESIHVASSQAVLTDVLLKNSYSVGRTGRGECTGRDASDGRERRRSGLSTGSSRRPAMDRVGVDQLGG